MFEEALSAVKRHGRIVIFRHSNPDGDAIGSQTGLKHIIKENFPEKEVYAVGDPAGRYSFMDDSVMDSVDDGLIRDSLAVILDTSSAALISDGRYTLAAETLRIDHHIFITKLADTEVVDTSYESCCGLITEFARECALEVPVIAARALYTGTVTDSGRFRYDSVSSGTFERCAFLLKQPFDTEPVFSALYSDDFGMIKLRAQFILKIKFTEKNVAYIYTDFDEFSRLGVSPFTISRGMVGVMSDIRGVDIRVNFTETEDGVLCEIRSSGHNINPVAVRHGGGGHAKASGATLKDRAEAEEVLRELDALTEEDAV